MRILRNQINNPLNSANFLSPYGLILITDLFLTSVLGMRKNAYLLEILKRILRAVDASTKWCTLIPINNILQFLP